MQNKNLKRAILSLCFLLLLAAPVIALGVGFSISDIQSAFTDILNAIKSKLDSIASIIPKLFLAGLSDAPGYAEVDLDTGLIGHWKFDEGSGDIANDSSGHGHNGALVGGPVWKDGGVLSFDGIDDYVDFGDIDAFEFGPDDEFTIYIWFKMGSHDLFDYVLGKSGSPFYSTGASNGALAFYYYKGNMYFNARDGINLDRAAFYAPFSNWQHVAIVAGKQNEIIDFYVNGELQEGKSITRTTGQLTQDNNHFTIGGPDFDFTGMISEVRVYNRALSPEEVAALSNRNQYELNLHFHSDRGNVTLTPDYELYNEGAEVTLTAVPREPYYYFNGWTGDITSRENPITITMDSNKDITANLIPKVPAFPGAEGFGGYTLGGRGGRVIHVTTLEDNSNDKNPIQGSLRAALLETGPRIIVFDVGGVIEIGNKQLTVKDGYFTIAGQTAPGGITIMGNQIVTTSTANNIIIRNLRIRGGHNFEGGADAMRSIWIDSNNFILDHVAAVGASDQGVNGWTNSDYYTWQYLSAEATALWGEGGAHHPEGDHNRGAMQGNNPDAKLTIHHSLFLDHLVRLPQINGAENGGADFRNNIVYNWMATASNLFEGRFNVIGNSWVVGPSVNDGVASRRLINANPNAYFYPENFTSNLYFKGLGTGPEPDFLMPAYPGRTFNFLTEPWPAEGPPVTTQSAIDGYNSVLDEVGAWPRDATTRRAVAEVQTGTATGGVGLRGPYEYFPERIGPSSIAYDTDRDGMPNNWEINHGLNSSDVNDRNNIVQIGDPDPDGTLNRHIGYTYIEYYINELADSIIGRDVLLQADGSIQEIPIHKIQASVFPIDTGAVVASHGVYDQELFAYGGYNSPYWFGKIDFDTAEYNEGSIVIMKAKAKPGYDFDHWEGGPVDGLTSTQISFPATSDTNIIAHFVPLNSYDISAEVLPLNSGGVAGVGSYEKGEIVTLSAYSNGGYKFKNWAGGPIDGFQNPTVQFVADQDYNIQAVFESGSGGDVLIDDFNDQSRNYGTSTKLYRDSYIIEPITGNAKRWDLFDNTIRFHEVIPGSGDFALETLNNSWGIIKLAGSSQEATSDIPPETTVIKFKVYNIGSNEARMVNKKPADTGVAHGDGRWDHMDLHMSEDSGRHWAAEPLYYDKPFKFPVIQPGESGTVAFPLNLLRTRDLTRVIKPMDNFRYFRFGHLGQEHIWGSQVVIDDIAFGTSGVDEATLPNLAPVANAGRDQITKDVDGDGKEHVLLNGLKSYDANAGLIKTWRWTLNGAEIATGFAPTVELPVGAHNIQLTITDESNASSSDAVQITVLRGDSSIPPTLRVSLTASPSSGSSPLTNVSLTANVSGTSAGNTTYTFYCNRQDTNTSITTPYDAQYPDQAQTTKTALNLCNYEQPGNYTAKVIAERGTLSAQARVSVNVQPPPENCQDADQDDINDYNPAVCPSGRDICIKPKQSLTSQELEQYQPFSNTYELIYDTAQADIRDLPDFKLRLQDKAEIQFTDNLDLIRLRTTDGCFERINFDQAALIDQNKAEINTTLYPELNKPAQITFYNITLDNPIIKKDGAICQEPACRILSYDRANHILTIEVASFSGYAIVSLKSYLTQKIMSYLIIVASLLAAMVSGAYVVLSKRTE